MADTVTITQGDTLTGVLKIRRKLQDHEVYAWLDKLRLLNPHISDLNRIYPGEQLLIPDSLMENVTETAVWSNAFSKIPRALTSPHNGHTQLFLTTPGTSIDTIAKRMFTEGPYRNLPLSTKRAVLIHNNPELVDYLDNNRISTNKIVDITPLRLSKFDKNYWQGERSLYQGYLESFDGRTRDMFQQVGAEDTYLFARIIQSLQEAGAAVGADDVVRGAGYGISGVSGLAESSTISTAQVNSLLQEMASDAAQKFGLKRAASKRMGHLTEMTAYLKSHPNYPKVMHHLKELPDFLLPKSKFKIVPPNGGNVNSVSLARNFRKGYFQAFRRWPSRRYMAPIAKQLNGRINLFKGAGRAATWYIPAIIGLYNVSQASPEMRMRTLFEEGFGVVGGYFGTKAGVVLGLGIVAALGLGPFGLFITVFICASAGGIIGNELFKWGGGKIYSQGQIISEKLYYSIEELVGACQ